MLDYPISRPREISGISQTNLWHISGKSLVNLRLTAGKSQENLRHISGKFLGKILGKYWANLSQVLIMSRVYLSQIICRSWANLRQTLGKSCAVPACFLHGCRVSGILWPDSWDGSCTRTACVTDIQKLLDIAFTLSNQGLENTRHITDTLSALPQQFLTF